MKKVIGFLLLIPIVVLLLLALSIGLILQQGIASKSDLAFLYDLGKREGPAAIIDIVKLELYGVDESTVSDPSYGREQIAGRGHAPWVIRGNLDGKPRMLKFALQPNLWAAYDTQSQSLYQVWEGDVLFEGAAYDYKHGPQPASTGNSYLRESRAAAWFIEVDDQEIPATVNYLGHEYGPGRTTASMQFALVAGDIRLELKETPEVETRNGERFFVREFLRIDNENTARAVFRTANGVRNVASGPLEFPLNATTPITVRTAPDNGHRAENSELSRGESVIANSDCLGCHGEHHKIAGPAWSQISGKFRGKLQQQVINALANSVINGSEGTWGLIPMPPHADLSEEQAREAVAYILSVGEPQENHNAPVSKDGVAYQASTSYDVLPRLLSLHPSFKLENLAPPGFEPKVGGMAFRDDGKLVLSSWDKDGTVFLLDLQASPENRVTRIAEGLQEPLGLTTIGDRIFVLQKQELTELIDTNGDDIIDEYRNVSSDWPSSSNFHSFAFGLMHRDQAFYFLLSICVLPGGASCPDQLPTQGKLLRADYEGNVEVIASGFRTPNGIGLGPDNAIYVTDNQGDWLPASKLVRIEEGNFYGSRAVPDENIMARVETPPVVWLPQDEVGNSPTEPLLLQEGPYAGQMIHGDVYNGGIKRVFIEQVNGKPQGAAFHFSAGFQAPVNRLIRGPDGAIYIGEVGSRPNWGEYDKPWHGLERLTYTGDHAFEMRTVKARSNGFDIELTEPLAANIELKPEDLMAKQWFYYPNEQYGGPKYDESALSVTQLTVSEDRRTLRAELSQLKPGYVIYLRLDDRLRSASNKSMWTREAWYTLNALPPLTQPTPKPQTDKTIPTGDDNWQSLFDGKTLTGWRNYGGDESKVEKWRAENGTLTLTQDGVFPLWDLISSVLFGGASGDLIYYQEKFRDFELSLQWKISENGNSGIFYLVADETENMPWLTGVEMQILDNEGHSDGEIITHRAGDLYDLVSATPETVLSPGEWNDVRIRIQDNHIEHWLNGEKVVSIERGGKQWESLVAASKFSDMPRFGKSAEGHIVLQDHGDPVWYRNIKVRKLPSNAPAP